MYFGLPGPVSSTTTRANLSSIVNFPDGIGRSITMFETIIAAETLAAPCLPCSANAVGSRSTRPDGVRNFWYLILSSWKPLPPPAFWRATTASTRACFPRLMPKVKPAGLPASEPDTCPIKPSCTLPFLAQLLTARQRPSTDWGSRAKRARLSQCQRALAGIRKMRGSKIGFCISGLSPWVGWDRIMRNCLTERSKYR